MKKLILITLCILIVSCNDKKSVNITNPLETIKLSDSVSKKETVSSEKILNTNGFYFKAQGAEPFWSLSISEKMITLRTLNDTLFTPHTAPELAADSNVKLYKLRTELTTMNIKISQSECSNIGSGLTSPYSVNIDFKKGKTTHFKSFEGCGAYLTDYRLEDIWVLESMNGTSVYKDDFGKDLPSMEINSSSNSFIGSTGCNKMSGQLFFEYKKLRFTNIAITKMMCPNNNKEQDFLLALKSGTSYAISNNRLTLSNGNGELLVFKKID